MKPPVLCQQVQTYQNTRNISRQIVSDYEKSIVFFVEINENREKQKRTQYKLCPINRKMNRDFKVFIFNENFSCDWILKNLT